MPDQLHADDRPIDLLGLYLQDCADAGEDPIVILCVLLQGEWGSDDFQAQEISEKVMESATSLVDWDDETPTLAHEVARLIRRIYQRRLMENLREALWAEES